MAPSRRRQLQALVRPQTTTRTLGNQSLLPLGLADRLVGKEGEVARAGQIFAFFAGDAYVPLTLTSIRHTSTTYAGVTLTVSTVAWTAGAWVQARLIARKGQHSLAVVGL